jgi:hypothetical protein
LSKNIGNSSKDLAGEYRYPKETEVSLGIACQGLKKPADDPAVPSLTREESASGEQGGLEQDSSADPGLINNSVLTAEDVFDIPTFLRKKT